MIRRFGTELELSSCWNNCERIGGTTGSASQANIRNGALTPEASETVGAALLVPAESGMTPPDVMAQARKLEASAEASPMDAKAPMLCPNMASRLVST